MRDAGETFQQHTCRRVRERYGLELGPFEYRCLVAKVRAGKARLAVRQTERVAAWWVAWAGVELLVTYDEVFRKITTCLDPRTTFLGSGEQDWAANRAAGVR